MSNKKPSQARQILGYMKTTSGIVTPRLALELFGCMRLAARVHELRLDGHNIQKMTVTTGTGKKVAAYFWRPAVKG